MYGRKASTMNRCGERSFRCFICGWWRNRSWELGVINSELGLRQIGIDVRIGTLIPNRKFQNSSNFVSNPLQSQVRIQENLPCFLFKFIERIIFTTEVADEQFFYV